MKLREDQGEAVLAIMEAWDRGVRRPAAILPTGWGKTVAFSALAVLQEASYNRRPLILVARDELVRQSVATLRKVARPHQKVGILQGPVDETATSHIVVASVQTLSRPKRLAKIDPRRFDLIVCDEAHWSDATSWRRVMERFGCFDETSPTLTLGVTATMTRSGKHKLGEIWEEVVYEKDTKYAIDQGFLVPVSAQTVVLPELDLSKVRTQHGDLSEADLGKAMAQAKAGPLIAAAYSEHARDADGELRRGIVFTPTIATAEAFLEDFRNAGIPSELVIGSTPVEERQAKYELTRRGVNKVLMSVSVLTTGFDLPAVEVAVMARPTKSRGLYIQCVGRALRLSLETGKTDALILDVVGASRLGLASIADLRISDEHDGHDGSERVIGGSLQMPTINPDAPDGIEFREVDPFSGERKKLARSAKKKAWLLTRAGTPFLPRTTTFESDIFLRAEADGLWGVCEAPKYGPMVCHEHGLPFPLAVEAAYAHYPVTPRPLSGPASDSQLDLLTRCGIEHEADIGKQAASELLAVAFASRRIDAR